MEHTYIIKYQNKQPSTTGPMGSKEQFRCFIQFPDMVILCPQKELHRLCTEFNETLLTFLLRSLVEMRPLSITTPMAKKKLIDFFCSVVVAGPFKVLDTSKRVLLLSFEARQSKVVFTMDHPLRRIGIPRLLRQVRKCMWFAELLTPNVDITISTDVNTTRIEFEGSIDFVNTFHDIVKLSTNSTNGINRGLYVMDKTCFGCFGTSPRLITIRYVFNRKALHESATHLTIACLYKIKTLDVIQK